MGFRGSVWVGILLSIGLMTTGVCGMPTAVADANTPVIRLCGTELAVKPQHIVFTCADATWAIDNLVWRSWKADGATGSGVEYERACVPDCADGKATYTPVTITLTGATLPITDTPARSSPTKTQASPRRLGSKNEHTFATLTTDDLSWNHPTPILKELKR